MNIEMVRAIEHALDASTIEDAIEVLKAYMIGSPAITEDSIGKIMNMARVGMVIKLAEKEVLGMIHGEETDAFVDDTILED